MTEKELKTCACVEDNCNCKEIAESELRRKLDLLLRTGSILMESAADTSRIMRTISVQQLSSVSTSDTCTFTSTGTC